MPQVMTISDLGRGGLNTDLPPVTLPPNTLSSANNIRLHSGAVRAFGGSAALQTAPISPKFLFPVDALVDVWALVDEDSAYSWNGVSFAQIDNAEVIAADPYLWSGCHLSRIPILSNIGQSPVYIDLGLNQMLSLPYTLDQPGGTVETTWKSEGYFARSIRSFGQYLVAFNIIDGPSAYPDMVHWSHPADLGELPYSWDSTDPETLSERFSLGGNGGDIIDAYALKNGMAIYRERGISFLDATNDNSVFTARHVTDIVQLPNVRSIIEVKGTHFLLTADDVVAHDGNQVSSIMHDRVRKQYAREFNSEYATTAFAMHNSNGKEIWFCISVYGAGADRAYVYNYRDSSWSIRDLPGVQHASLGPINSEVRTYDTWTETFETATGTFDQGRTLPTDKTVIAASGTQMTNLDPPLSDNEIVTTMERTNIALNGHDNVTTLLRAYPHIESTATVKITLGSHQFVNGPVKWQKPVSFLPGRQRSIDIRTTGRLHAYRIEATTKQPLAVSGIDLEFVPAGRR